jgi:hypothetical protein
LGGDLPLHSWRRTGASFRTAARALVSRSMNAMIDLGGPADQATSAGGVVRAAIDETGRIVLEDGDDDADLINLVDYPGPREVAC